jgi:small subunit ribosomal protein S18
MTKKIKLKMSARLSRKRMRKNGFSGQKHCRFCGNTEMQQQIDYKNAYFLKGFLTERGKILPARISGNSCKWQRRLSKEIKKARTMALLPYTSRY